MNNLFYNTGSARRAALVLAALGFAVRVALAIWFGIAKPPEPGSDGQEYDTYAWNLAQGNGYRGMSPDVADPNHLTAYRPPGTSVVWAGLYALFGHRYDVVRLSNCLWGAISVWLVFEIGRLCYGNRLGLLAAAICVFFPTGLIFTIDLMSDALGTLLFLALIWLALLFARQPGWGLGIAAGLALGLGMLTRPNTLFMLPMLCVWAVWQFRGRWLVLLQAAAIGAVGVATLIPWTIRNYIVFREIIPFSTMGGSGLLQGNNDIVVTDPVYFGYSIWDTKIPEYSEALKSAGNEVERDRRAKKFAVEWLGNNRDKWGFLLRAKLWRSLTPFLQPHTPRLHRLAMLVSWGPVLVLFTLAFVPTLVEFLRRGHPGWLIHLGILHYIVVSLIFYALSRYRMPVEPLCIVLALRGLEMATERLRGNQTSCTTQHAVEAGD